MIGWLSAALLLACAWVVFRSRRRWRRYGELTARIASMFEAMGARPVGDGVFEWDGRRWQAEVEAPGLLGGPLGITVALFTDRVHEFYVRQAGGLPARVLPLDEFYRDYSIEGRTGPALERYLLEVKPVLERAMPGRWKTFGKGFVILYFSDSVQDAARFDADELKLAMRALRVLDRPIDDPLRGGAFTFRSGFEPDLPPWHWPQEAVRALPPGIKRAVVSFYHENAYLNEGLVDLLRELAGAEPKTFISAHDRLDFLRHAFGDAVRIDGSSVQSDRLDVPASADQYLDGAFFAAFVAGELPASARGLPRHALHDALVRELGSIKFYARRLLDDEASWFSGEIEILSLSMSDEEFGRALEKTAVKYGAKIMPLERRFTLKVFRDEKFEYST